jgi:hypothetical protein
MASDELEVVRERRVKAQPSAARMLADIEAIVGFGIRRPGYPADRQAEEWAARRFTELGLRDVVLEPVDVPGWEPGAATLEVWPARDRAAAVRFTGFPLPYTQGCTDLERDLVGVDAAGARDQIVVEPLTLIDLPQSFMRDAATFSFDPDGEFDTLVQTLPFGPGFNRVADCRCPGGRRRVRRHPDRLPVGDGRLLRALRRRAAPALRPVAEQARRDPPAAADGGGAVPGVAQR